MNRCVQKKPRIAAGLCASRADGRYLAGLGRAEPDVLGEGLCDRAEGRERRVAVVSAAGQVARADAREKVCELLPGHSRVHCVVRSRQLVVPPRRHGE